MDSVFGLQARGNYPLMIYTELLQNCYFQKGLTCQPMFKILKNDLSMSPSQLFYINEKEYKTIYQKLTDDKHYGLSNKAAERIYQ